MMKNIKKNILEKIENNEVKMKPKWWFVAKALGIRGIWWLMILAVSISISVIVYFWQIYEPAEMMEFGEIGTDLILNDFPYVWLVGTIVFFTGGMVLLSKLGDNYKKTVKTVLALTSVAVILTTILVVLTRNLLKL